MALFRKKSSLRQGLRHAMENEASSYREWRRMAKRVDVLDGNDRWRTDPDCTYFNARELQHRVDLLRQRKDSCDTRALMFSLRSELLRNISGLGHPKLHNTAFCGTKRIAEEYIESVAEALDFIADEGTTDPNSEDLHALRERLAFFTETRHAYGRSALLLSGGATMGLYHLGVVKALLERSLLPKIISGASAGSIVAALVASKSDRELYELVHNLNINLHFFGVKSSGDEAEEPSALRAVAAATLSMLPAPLQELLASSARIIPRWLKTRTLLDIEECLRANIGTITFLDAYNHSGRILNITVTPNNSHDYPRLLNYLTAPNVQIWSAVLASCAIPGVFAPVEIVSVNQHGDVVPYLPGGLRWTDGSLEYDLPTDRLAELFNVNQFIVSQVNPHAHLFAGVSLGSGRLAQGIRFLKREIKAFIRNIADLGIAIPPLAAVGRGLIPLITQKYEGDCTIVPPCKWDDIVHLLSNPSIERLANNIKVGERATWKTIPWLRFHCLIEFALDDCLNRVRDRFTQAMSAQQNIRRDQTLAITAADSDAAGSPTHAAGSHEMRMLGTGRGMMGRVSSFHAVNSFAALSAAANSHAASTRRTSAMSRDESGVFSTGSGGRPQRKDSLSDNNSDEYRPPATSYPDDRTTLYRSDRTRQGSRGSLAQTDLWQSQMPRTNAMRGSSVRLSLLADLEADVNEGIAANPKGMGGSVAGRTGHSLIHDSDFDRHTHITGGGTVLSGGSHDSARYARLRHDSGSLEDAGGVDIRLADQGMEGRPAAHSDDWRRTLEISTHNGRGSPSGHSDLLRQETHTTYSPTTVYTHYSGAGGAGQGVRDAAGWAAYDHHEPSLDNDDEHRHTGTEPYDHSTPSGEPAGLPPSSAVDAAGTPQERGTLTGRHPAIALDLGAQRAPISMPRSPPGSRGNSTSATGATTAVSGQVVHQSTHAGVQPSAIPLRSLVAAPSAADAYTDDSSWAMYADQDC